MESKVFLITGSNTGIGFSAARELAKEKNATLLLLCRDPKKGEEACNKIKSLTGNNNIDYIDCNLASFDSIRSAVKTINQKTSKIDVLLNNAGVAKPKFSLSQDNIELTFAINHIGHFYLTLSLLDLLKKSPSGRIVTVSSDSHRAAFTSFYKDINFTKRKYSSLRAYIQSKLANVSFTYLLAEKLKGTTVTANVLDPGNVKTDIHRDVHKLPFLSRLIFKLVKPFFLDVDEGAKTSVYVCLSDDLEGVSGKYYYKQKESKSSRLSYNKELQNNIWKLSEELTNLKEII